MSIIATTLGRSYRARYPFRLGTTSFIVPDDYLPNVRQLAPFFDEVELLFFEAVPGGLDLRLIEALAALKAETGIGYNVHLPVDLPLCGADAPSRRKAAAVMADALRRSAVLAPSTFTLHLPYTPVDRRRDACRRWQTWVCDSLARVLDRAGTAGAQLSVETLDYPLEWLDAPIDRFDLRVCLDTGHLALAGVDLTAAYRHWASRCTIIHLHAAASGRDHLPLDQLAPNTALAVSGILAGFTGTVSLEVFSLEALKRSLGWLAANTGSLVSSTPTSEERSRS